MLSIMSPYNLILVAYKVDVWGDTIILYFMQMSKNLRNVVNRAALNALYNAFSQVKSRQKMTSQRFKI